MIYKNLTKVKNKLSQMFSYTIKSNICSYFLNGNNLYYNKGSFNGIGSGIGLGNLDLITDARNTAKLPMKVTPIIK